MAWQDDVYIRYPMGWHTRDFRSLAPCDYMYPSGQELEKDRRFDYRIKTIQKEEQFRKEIWEVINVYKNK
jgi:hypothetical protein